MKTTVLSIFGMLFGAFLLVTEGAQAVFNDVSSRSQYGPSILHLQGESIVEGYPDGTYRPNAGITRAEYTKILLLSKFTASQIATCNTPSFPDVEAEAWYYQYICFAKTNNIVAGYSDGAFRPNQPISYAEGAKILVNVLITNTNDAPPPEWWSPYTELLEEHGVNPPTVNNPTAPLTRGEMAFMASGTIRSTIADFIQERFDGKLVYVTNPGTTVNELKDHCAVEGGEFDECGSPCSPDAEVCADVCAYTCTLTSAGDDDDEERISFILERFGSKLVYDQKEGISLNQLQQHCTTEGGLFNSCGNVCAPDAQSCDTACAATCESIPQSKPNDDEDDEEEVTIMERFTNKLVYSTTPRLPVEKYEAHCEARGGTFDECGTTCAPDAEMCVQVCAYTCSDFETDEDDEPQTGFYENMAFGLRMEHPPAARISESIDSENDDYVELRLAGETQANTGALTDGIRLRVTRLSLGENTLSELTDAAIDDEQALTPITLPKETYTLSGREGYRFGSANGNFAFLPADEGEAFLVGSQVKDPSNSGYQSVLDAIFASLEFFDTKPHTMETSGISLRYPTLLTASAEANTLILTHEVPYEHPDACDFEGTAETLDELRDFGVTFKAETGNLEAAVNTNEAAGFAAEHLTADKTGLTPAEGFIETAEFNGLNGFRVTLGAEGCGEYHYYFPIKDDLTLFVSRAFVPEFSESYAGRDEALEVEGAILPERADKIFTDIVKSIEVPEETNQ